MYFNRKRNYQAFSMLEIEAVWSKGFTVYGLNPNEWRKDACGAWMKRSEYGQCTECGWEIDHVQPKEKGGSDELSNFQPLQWENNRYKSDNFPSWSCKIKAAA